MARTADKILPTIMRPLGVAFAAIALQLDVLGKTFIRSFAQPQMATRYGVPALTGYPLGGYG